ncbi:hypothetical protein IE53DRAFT_149866 [Violaceomyces palustris]|uniref:Uncharacterized protein n=1 Tax=Violaceomyces palustris TaxID=1673888 RepID=A0ACD0NUJ7_9BASI|nr:hypothetical protein IE53DRAFT_149866 [Violaceomyces palustris]
MGVVWSQLSLSTVPSPPPPPRLPRSFLLMDRIRFSLHLTFHRPTDTPHPLAESQERRLGVGHGEALGGGRGCSWRWMGKVTQRLSLLPFHILFWMDAVDFTEHTLQNRMQCMHVVHGVVPAWLGDSCAIPGNPKPPFSFDIWRRRQGLGSASLVNPKGGHAGFLLETSSPLPSLHLPPFFKGRGREGGGEPTERRMGNPRE